MPPAAHLDRERARLAALDSYDSLDTPRERDFDDIAALASNICETPIAVIMTSGHNRPDSADMPVRAVFLEKPYNGEHVIRTMRQMAVNLLKTAIADQSRFGQDTAEDTGVSMTIDEVL